MQNFLILVAVVFCYFLPDYKKIVNEDAICKLNALYEKKGIKYIDVVLAQDILETGNFNSKIALENLNIRGMKHNKRGLSLGRKNGHATYNSVEDGIEDFSRWQPLMMSAYHKREREERKGHISNKILQPNMPDSLYFHFLENLVIDNTKNRYRYAEDPNYISKIKVLLPQVKTYKKKKCECSKTSKK